MEQIALEQEAITKAIRNHQFRVARSMAYPALEPLPEDLTKYHKETLLALARYGREWASDELRRRQAANAPKPELKKPLVALEVANDRKMIRNILNGKKSITIRSGHRDYHIGAPVILAQPAVGFVVGATITNVLHTNLGRVSTTDLKADGFTSHMDMLKGMRKFYPDIHFAHPVTVIYWTGVSGKQAPKPKKAKTRSKARTRKSKR